MDLTAGRLEVRKERTVGGLGGELVRQIDNNQTKVISKQTMDYIINLFVSLHPFALFSISVDTSIHFVSSERIRLRIIWGLRLCVGCRV